MNDVDITVLDVEPPGWTDSCRRYTLNILKKLGIEGWEVSLAFCSDTYIRSLNKAYRGIDEPTDVLSFSQENPELPGQKMIAGDIVISLERLIFQAKEFGISENEELKRLIIHGLLHLAGMDHSTNEPEEEMIRRQELLLQDSGENIF